MAAQPGDIRRIFEKQGYEVIGDHAAVKHCHWLRKSLLFNTPCYKQTFYGIESHRCLQMTPAAYQCTQKCLFCWRYQGFTDTALSPAEAMDPDELLEGCVAAHQRLVSGFKGDQRCSPERWEEARDPKHVACSLTGEPTLYPFLSDFFERCHRRGMTTFLVTNGTMPRVLAAMDVLPTQLYVSVCAPTKEIYRRLCCPLIPDGWERLMETLQLLPSLGTRTVIRHTLVDGWNLGHEREYAALDAQAEPWFVEPKGYVHVGYSRQRLTMDHMPSHADVKRFGEHLAHHLGYRVLAERPSSRVVLLGGERERMI
ncbi:MAG: 4-demethylwyosine synthase TYW1 [Candidatus Thermoplasmatota archaeon]|nr:4-demethylwyosine synthase TYW1 [Candidatus Thermoplasmatota archaeon]